MNLVNLQQTTGEGFRLSISQYLRVVPPGGQVNRDEGAQLEFKFRKNRIGNRSGTDRLRLAIKLIIRRVDPAFKEGSGKSVAAAEEIAERGYGIGNVQVAAIVCISGIQAAWKFAFGEKENQQVDRICDAQASIQVDISTLEKNGKRIGETLKRIGGHPGTANLFEVGIKVPSQRLLENSALAVELRRYKLHYRHEAL
jgi:hypothetical protein